MCDLFCIFGELNIKSMKKLIFFSLFGLFFILLFSCDEDDNPTSPTINPLPYYPAYPGSYWIYTNGDTIKVADKYGLYSYCSDYPNGPIDTELFLPIITLRGDSLAYVKEYSFSNKYVSFYVPNFSPFFSQNIGIFYQSNNHGPIQTYGETVKVDTSITIDSVKYENVIITVYYDSQYYGSQYATLREYYAKNIGLIKRERRDFPTDTLFTTELELKDYYIK